MCLMTLQGTRIIQFYSHRILSVTLKKICDYICFIHKGELLLVEEKDLLLEKYAVIKLAKNQLETLPKDSIVRKIRTSFGYEVLVQKDKINAAFRVENTRLEDIILLMVKEGV